MRKITLLLMFFALANNSFSQELFNQNFNSSSTLSSYINSSGPSTGQFNAITTSGSNKPTITCNSLLIIRESGTTSFTRSSNFSITATAIIYQFDITVNEINSQV